MQPGLGGAERDPEGCRHLGQRHPQQVVQGDDGAMARIEPGQGIVEELPVGERRGGVAGDRADERGELDLDHPPAPAANEVETGIDDESVQPAVEPVRIAQSGQVAPGADGGFLDRVARELRVPEDQPGGGIQPREAQRRAGS